MLKDHKIQMEPALYQ
uniref:Uncharacterized protein n=1 Tax=Oryza punctata TaxID=4537 RepID=A0A0E0K6A9_ORYPU